MDFLQFINKNKSINKPVIKTTIKVGDYIRIIKYKTSPYNWYKGYIGEVRKYTSGSKYATIVLQASVNNIELTLPIEHFILI